MIAAFFRRAVRPARTEIAMLPLTNDYLLAWIAYGVAALGCLLVWFRLTRPLWRWLREPLRLVMAVLLLTPTLVDAERGLYAPAVAIGALDLAFKVGNSALTAVVDVVMYGLIAFSLYFLLVAVRWMLQRGRPLPAQTQPAAAQDDDDDDDWPRDRRPPGGRARAEPRL